MNIAAFTLLQLLVLLNLSHITEQAALEITWEKLPGVDLSKLDPVGYSTVTNKYYHLGRFPKDNGYLVGMFNTDKNELYSVDEKGETSILKDDSKVEIMKSPQGTLSWELVTNVLDIERFRHYLVSAAKDPTGEDVYFCRFVYDGRLIIGTYVFSKKPATECIQTWSDGQVLRSNVFEMLVLNQMGETLGVKLPNTDPTK